MYSLDNTSPCRTTQNRLYGTSSTFQTSAPLVHGRHETSIATATTPQKYGFSQGTTDISFPKLHRATEIIAPCRTSTSSSASSSSATCIGASRALRRPQQQKKRNTNMNTAPLSSSSSRSLGCRSCVRGARKSADPPSPADPPSLTCHGESKERREQRPWL